MYKIICIIILYKHFAEFVNFFIFFYVLCCLIFKMGDIIHQQMFSQIEQKLILANDY